MIQYAFVVIDNQGTTRVSSAGNQSLQTLLGAGWVPVRETAFATSSAGGAVTNAIPCVLVVLEKP